MKHFVQTKRPSVFLLLFILSLFSYGQPEIPIKTEVLANMVLANDYYMKKWPDPGADIVKDKVRPSNIWTRATYYEGLMALYQAKPDQKLLDYAVNWGEAHNWGLAYKKISRDGDNMCCGQTYLDLYKLDPPPGADKSHPGSS